MSTVSLTLDEIFDLAKKTLLANGCDDETASILSDLIKNAERDGSLSHGLFRLPAYVSGLKSGKINGKGKPDIKKISTSVIKVQGNNCLAPVVLNKGLPELAKAAKENGVAVLAINNSHHMAAMWPETEMIAEQGLVAFACTSYKPSVAPAGATKPCSAIISVSGHIAAIWCELLIAKTATPFSLAVLINSGKPLLRTIGAKQLFPKTLITLGEIFLTSGLAFPFIFPLLSPDT